MSDDQVSPACPMENFPSMRTEFEKHRNDFSPVELSGFINRMLSANDEPSGNNESDYFRLLEDFRYQIFPSYGGGTIPVESREIIFGKIRKRNSLLYWYTYPEYQL